MMHIQISRMPDGARYFCLARTIQSDAGGYHAPPRVHAIGLGCQVQHASEMVYADGVDLQNLDSATPVGVTCRVCERTDCEQRAFPSLRHRLHVDENMRGVFAVRAHRPARGTIPDLITSLCASGEFEAVRLGA